MKLISKFRIFSKMFYNNKFLQFNKFRVRLNNKINNKYKSIKHMKLMYQIKLNMMNKSETNKYNFILKFII